MPTVLLWNVQRKSLAAHVGALARQHAAGVVALIEPPEPDAPLTQALAPLGLSPVPSHERFRVYARQERFQFERRTPLYPEDRAEFWHVRDKVGWDALFVAVHGPDRVNTSAAGQAVFFKSVAEEIALMEAALGHKRTAVFGDFNANPFEESVESVRGLHAINARNVGGKSSRDVRRVAYDFFFNPMWTRFGSGTKHPPATYYYNGGDANEHFWHMLDQVVIRPELLPYFREDRLRILDRAGPTSLLTRAGHPGGSGSSDHLPLLFHLSSRRRK